MHLLFVLFDFTIVFCFAWDDYVASFCNSPPQECAVKIIGREAKQKTGCALRTHPAKNHK